MYKLQNIEMQQGKHPKLPTVQVGDILIAKYTNSNWAKFLPWENWHHAALVSDISNAIKIIETPGETNTGVKFGPQETNFYESSLCDKTMTELIILRPKWPNPIREKAFWKPRILRTKLSEEEARKRAVEYARKQIGKPYSLDTSKWSNKKWYCAKLVYKSYSMTVTDLYLESDSVDSLMEEYQVNFRNGVYVTPEDILDSYRSDAYFHFIKEV